MKNKIPSEGLRLGRDSGSILCDTLKKVAFSDSLGGVKRLSLTTDKINNESAIAFYRSCGYRILYEFSAYPNRIMLRMIKDLE